MKLPSLFRTPKYQRFHIEPRYYDPVKERIEERTEQIKRRIEASDKPASEYRSPIRGSFSRRKKQEAGSNIAVFLIFIMLSGTAAGYFFYGNTVFYIYLILIPLYIFFRRKRFFRS